jgi:hypothetical protein
VSPIFEIVPILSFADDSYNVETNLNKKELINDRVKKVNYEKTCIFFFKHDRASANITLGVSVIKSNTEINVLGVVFNSKLLCSNHISKVIIKANKAVNSIELIGKNFKLLRLLHYIVQF